MPMIDVTATEEIANDARARSNVVRLAAAQALTGANSAVIFATGSIIGATLAPDISLATVPLSMFVVGLAAGTLPTGAISRAYGRRTAFMIGTGCGVVTGVLAAFAILRGSFVLFCCATFLGGLYGAVSQSYRFAAADGASVSYRPKAVSWVMAGGVFAGVFGPQLVQWTMDIWPPYLFAASFAAQAVVARLGAPKIVALGLVLEAGAAGIGLSGITALHFWATLIVLGVGWNFGFVGASALVLETHRMPERNKVQAFNDFLVFGTMALGSFASGQVLANYGWAAVNIVVFPPVLLGLAVLTFASFAKRRRRLQAIDEFPEPSI